MWQALRRALGLGPRAIPDELWADTLRAYPFLQRLPAADQAALRALCGQFLARKEFHAIAPLQLTDAMALAVAAQACLPVLRLGLQHYDGWVGIVLHADEVVAPREVMDDDGVVHEYDETLSGEAMEGGPVMLSWTDVQMAGQGDAYNVVIHEFVHKLDMADGEVNGVPALPSRAAREHWVSVLSRDYARLCSRVQRGRRTYLDPYAAEHVSEFFAVASEAFFVDAAAFKAEHASLYELFAGFYQQRPAG
ncbi:MAG: zinc-dependent peptidase [Betaproteobacteria bacterium]|nr:zinc-dependent peptidase [Betaproteobacteria bacterium]